MTSVPTTTAEQRKEKEYICKLCNASRLPSEMISHLHSAHIIRLNFLDDNPSFVKAVFLVDITNDTKSEGVK
jgi:hypothetical protein